MWVAAKAFEEATGLKLNTIPQAGVGAFVIAQVAGGHTDLGVLALPAAKPQIEAGNVRFLAVIGSKKAHGYNDIPTLKEIGYDVSIDSTNFVVGPPKMPKDIADKLTKAFEGAANDPEYKRFVIEHNGTPLYLPPEKLFESLAQEEKVYRMIMEKAGILKEK